jgi:hypothetical protein
LGVQLYKALKSGAIVHVSDVESGLHCGCICPNCGAALVAKKGPKRRKHFAHHNAVECDLATAAETALHLLAKQILNEDRRLWLPPVQVIVANRDISGREHSKSVKLDSKTIDLGDVEMEAPVGPFWIDVMGHPHGRQLAIEIRVTHSVHKEKIDYLCDHGVSTLEIDLSCIDRDIAETELRRLLTQESELVKWLFNARAELMRADLERELNLSVAGINDGLRREQEKAERTARAKIDKVRIFEGELSEYLISGKLPDNDPAYAAARKCSDDIVELLGLEPMPDQPQINVAVPDGRAFACAAWVWQGWILYTWLLSPTPDKAIGSSFRTRWVTEWATKHLPIPRCVRFLDYPVNRQLCNQASRVPSPYHAVRQYLAVLESHGYLRRGARRRILRGRKRTL